MLLSIPVIVGAGVLEGYHLYKAGDAALTANAFLAVGFSFVTALLAIVAMMAWLKRSTYTPFVIYRIVLGVFLLGVVYGWIG
jgi:undecaprenyl-diphosphatase